MFTPGASRLPGFFCLRGRSARLLLTVLKANHVTKGKRSDPWIVAPDAAGKRLDAWLAARPEIGSRGRAQDALACGKVFLNDAEVTFADAGRRLAAGDRIGYWPDRPGSSKPRRREIVSARASLDVVHQDAEVLVVNKPPGWIVEPLPGEKQGEVTLLDLVADHLGMRAGGTPAQANHRPYVVHRIDRDTSGLVLFALSPAARDHLKAQFERQSPDRIYLAVVNGHPRARVGHLARQARVGQGAARSRSARTSKRPGRRMPRRGTACSSGSSGSR